MSCSFTEKISSLIDGELSPAEAREVERHLVTCGQCAEARADFLNLRSQIAGFESSLTPVVQNRALAKILVRRREGTVSGAPAVWSWNWGASAVALASMAIVALVVGLIYYQTKQGSLEASSSHQKEQPLAYQSQSVKTLPESKPSPSPEPQKLTDQQKTETPRKQPQRKLPPREPKPGEQFASIPVHRPDTQPVRPADAQTLTALHLEKAETLLRAFRNVRLDESDSATEVAYERSRARQLVYQNMMLRREADAAGDVQMSSLLENLEPILLDIANLPDKPDDDSVRVIRDRVERKNIVALLQVNSTALARALD